MNDVLLYLYVSEDRTKVIYAKVCQSVFIHEHEDASSSFGL